MRRVRRRRAGGAAVSGLRPERVLVAGQAAGPVLFTTEPLSFWGGLDPQSGLIIDQRHPLVGQSVTGKVFVFPYGRGSSSSSGILLEAIRLGTAPAAIINWRVDGILALGILVGREMYGRTLPLLTLDPADFATLGSVSFLTIRPDGSFN